MNVVRVVFFLAVFSIGACSTKRSTSSNHSTFYQGSIQYSKDKVLVLLIDLSKSSANLRRAKLVDGVFKPLPLNGSHSEFVRIQYIDDQDRILFEKELENPLIQYREYDEDGQIKRIRTLAEKGSILVRSQHTNLVKAINIDYGRFNSFSHIAKLPIVLVQ